MDDDIRPVGNTVPYPESGKAVFRVVNDFRIRLPGDYVIVGDELPGRDGRPVRVVARRVVDGKLYLIAAPEAVCRAFYGDPWPYETPR